MLITEEFMYHAIVIYYFILGQCQSVLLTPLSAGKLAHNCSKHAFRFGHIHD